MKLREVQSKFYLYPCVPNPFNPKTLISYDLPITSQAYVSIYDVFGRLVRTLKQGVYETPGYKSMEWDGLDNSNTPAAAGVYLVCLKTEHFKSPVRVMLIK